MSNFRLTRRSVMLGGSATASFAAGLAVLDRADNGAEFTSPSLNIGTTPVQEPIIPEGIVSALSILNDIVMTAGGQSSQEIMLQTNGAVLCIDLVVSKAAPDLSKIILEVSDLGHDASGAQVSRARSVAMRDLLRGPSGSAELLDGGPNRLLIVLADPLFNQDSVWRSTIESIRFLGDWLPGRIAETIEGAAVVREDTLAYPPFPVRPLTPPFKRMAVGEDFHFEITGMHEWGRDTGMFARVEAWAHINGTDGPIAASSTMELSRETPSGGTQPGLPAPVYSLLLTADGLVEGIGEIRYRVLPFIGPAWASTERGETFPTLGAPKAVPFCNDLSGSWAPVFGIVNPMGIGLAGTDLRGLGFSIDTAINSGLAYRDCAAVAAAVKAFNASVTAQETASGWAQRAVVHNDISGGVAVLRSVPGSELGSNFGAYYLRTAFNSLSLFPPGATCFEIRSETGLPDASTRLRGVDANGVAISSKTRLLPSRLVLRGIWIDGTGTVGAQNITIDGAAITGNTALATSVFLVMIDCVVTQNPTAGTGSPARTRFNFVWDIRLKLDGNGSAPPLLGIVASVGSSYASLIAGRRMPLAALVGVKLRNIGVEDQLAKSRLLLNVRFDFDKAFSSPMIMLGNTSPSRGGLGIGNTFCRGTVDSGGPIMQVGADGTMLDLDNVIIRHFASDLLGATKVNNGRSNVMYQDQGYVRVDKIGSVSFSAFRSYNIKGDTFPATEKPNLASTSWISGQAYTRGRIVHDTQGLATAASTFYQALTATTASLSDPAAWAKIGLVFNTPYGEQPRRQGNLKFRYHVGCHGNVACVTYNGASSPSRTSGFGISWGGDELVNADFARFYRNPFGDDYTPNASGGNDPRLAPLINRVPAGAACLPFDLVGVIRRNDGSGAAGAFELA